MSPHDKKLIAALFLLILERRRRHRRLSRRRIWARECLNHRERCRIVNIWLRKIHRGDRALLKNFLPISGVDFDYLLEKVTPLIRKEDTSLKKAITPAMQLLITLNYLATGNRYQILSHLFHVPVETIEAIIPKVCRAIFSALKPKYFKVPNTTEEWTKIVKGFETKCDFPNCIGAMGSKHINIKDPGNNDFSCFTVKHTHSIILMGLVDTTYRFTYINVGAPGRDTGSDVFLNSELLNVLEDDTWNIPGIKPLPGRTTPVPHVVVADASFRSEPYMLMPFMKQNQSVSERVFNYRLSGARRIIENVFAIISTRFRVLKQTETLPIQKVRKIVCAVTALHNFLIQTQSVSMYAPNIVQLESRGGCVESTESAKTERIEDDISGEDVREEFKDYFCCKREVC